MSTPQKGTRANLTCEAFKTATYKVMKTLDEPHMKQCFPKYVKEFPALIKMIHEKLDRDFKDQAQKHFDEVLSQWKFVEKANELDEILQEAKEKSNRAMEPEGTFIKGTDAKVVVSSATVPQLRDAAAVLRKKRADLAAKNEAELARIKKEWTNIAQNEARLGSILQDFENALHTLQEVDLDEITRLNKVVVSSLPEAI